MAPLKPLNKQMNTLTQQQVAAYQIKTRSQLPLKKDVFPKRKADGSPLKRSTVKRSAFGDVTNAQCKENLHDIKAKTSIKKTVLGVLSKPLSVQNINKQVTTIKTKEVQKPSVVPPVLKKKTVLTTVKNVATNSTTKSKAVTVPKPVKDQENVIRSGPVTRRSVGRKSSSDLEKTEDGSLYVSALEALDLEDKKSSTRKQKKERVIPPEGVEDFDGEQLEDLASVAVYAMDIFEYLKSREKNFTISDYMGKQTGLNTAMRALLVDWMVEVQENFELNHETLYLAVKIVDLYLSKVIVNKESLQLLGCASLFIACKYDERVPPLIEDFLYVCDDLYSADELIRMEIKILKTLEFDLGAPLSYRFLRRYARCAKVEMPLLTLARYILEYALMEYSTIHFSDSKIASAALYLALKMKKDEKGPWSSTLEYFSGYKVEDFKEIALVLNSILHKKPKESLKTIRNKYSHQVFHQVALTPLLDNSEL